jgi:dienelactone hydrolase
MRRLSAILIATLFLIAVSVSGADDRKDPFRVLEPGKLPKDNRLEKPKDLNGYFPMTVPASKDAWEKRRQDLREQVLVANGLWPMPEKAPLQPVIHGKIDRDDYTIEKVFFASLPGHYVTGNLYRPKGKTGKLAGVLCPHGHWANGRFYENAEKGIENDLKNGAEKTKESARYPLQARCAQLARMGCVVFHYDMVGYADSKPIGHRAGFTDADAELRLQSFMGLQTFNSIRALDFLASLPDVDPKRLGVTGASGGGTQTFILGAVDDRPAVAFPAVMVSTAMQGGCICENCSLLRQEAGNIDLAALFAPKPLAMSGANDWTVAIETKGLPELKKVYGLYGAEEKVLAKCFPQFGHNYNQVSRELMYNWFNKYLQLGQQEPVAEKPFVPVAPKELSVFDEQHPLPKDAAGAEALRKYLSDTSDKQIAALLPTDADTLKEFRRVIGTALRVMINDSLPKADEVEETKPFDKEENDGLMWRRFFMARKGKGEQIPAVGLRGKDFDGTVVVWIHPAGKSSLWQDGKLVPAAQQIISKRGAILAPDVFWTGEGQGTVVRVKADPQKLQDSKLSAQKIHQAIDEASKKTMTPAKALGNLLFLFPRGAVTADSIGNIVVRMQDGQAVRVKDLAETTLQETLPLNDGYAGYTFGYNRPLLANRVHDILTAVAFAKGYKDTKTVHLVGWDKAGPWVLLARPLCGDAVARTAADGEQYHFDKVRTVTDDMMLPGALKYGGLSAFAALSAPAELYLHNHRSSGLGQWLKPAYKAAGKPDNYQHAAEKAPADKVVDWLLR